MKKHSSKALSKKIMLSLMVAGVMSSYAAGVAGAADSDKVITGPYIAPGPVDLEQIIVTNDAVELNYGGKVTHIATAENSDDRTVYISDTQGSLTAKDVAFTGDVKAANGASITLTGGSVIAGPYYEDGVLDGGTELAAVGMNSTVTATGVDIQSDINAVEGGKVVITDSNIKTDESIWAEGQGSTVTISNNSDSETITIAAKSVAAMDGGSVTVNSGLVGLEQVLVSSGGTVELLGGGTVEHSWTGEHSSMVLVEGAGSSLSAKDIDFAGNVRVADGASMTLNGGTVLAGPGYGEVYATGKGSSIAATNTDFTGDVYAADGADVTLNGGSVTSVVGFQYYYNTALFAEGEGSTLTATDVDIKSRVFASDGGKVTIVDSNILKTDDSIEVNADSTVDISSTDGSHTYTVAYIAAEGGSVKVNSGEVQLEQVFVSYGGTVELLGGGYVDHLWTGEGTPSMVLVEGEGSSLYAKDVDFTGNVKVADGASMTLNGGSVRTGPNYGDAYATGKGSSIAAANTDFVGNVYAADGANVTLNGGDVTAVVSYTSSDGSYYYNTALYATGEGSALTATDVNIKSGVFAANGGKVTIVDSDIKKTDDNIQAESNGTVDISSTDGSNTYTVSYISAIDGGSATVNSGKVQLEQVWVNDGGSVELLGGGTITAKMDEETGNYQAIEANESGSITGSNLDITGSVYAHTGSSVTLTGGSITGAEGENNLGEIEATDGGTITLNNVAVKTSINAYTREDGEGAGTVIVNNSDVDAVEGFYAGNGGIIKLNGGVNNTYTAADYIITEGSGKIYINGGTLEADNLRALTHGIYEEETGSTIDSADGGIVLAGDGKISTMTDQIFDVAAYDAATDTVTGKETVIVDNKAIDYQGGTLIFNDAKYTLEYLSSAKNALLNYQSNEQESFASNTVISMKGDLVGTDGKEQTNTTVDVITSALGEDVVLEKVTVTAGQNLLVGTTVSSGTEVADIEIGHSVESGFGAADLHLGVGFDGMVITNGSKVTLVGRGDGENIIQALDDTGVAKAVQVIVGTAEKISEDIKQHGILNIGSEGLDNKLTGSVTVNAGSTLNTTGQTTITKGVTLNGAKLNNAELNVLRGQLTTNIITVSGAADITGAVKAGTLTVIAADEKIGAAINIGNESKAGNVTVEEIALNGGTVFLDPVWDANGKDQISNASGLAVVNIEKLDGNYIVGRNSLLSLGAERAEAEEVFKETGLTWGANKNNISAAAYIAGNIYVEKNASLVVNGNWPEEHINISGDGSVSFAANSLLMVNGEAIKVGASVDSTTAAISGVTAAKVDGTSQLRIANASKPGTYKILAGTGIGDGWLEENVAFTNQLMGVERIDKAGDHFNVISKNSSVSDRYGDDAVVIADIIDDARANYPDSVAAKFFNRAVDITVNDTDAQQIGALNNAAAMSELAGVSHAAYSASNILTNAVADHMSLARSVDHDTDIWAHYVHTKENIDGLAAAGSGAKYDAQYNGIVVGADLYKQGKGVVGAALTYIDGKVTGSTKNEAEYYGLSIYGGVQNEDSAVIGDISYLHGKNEITQNNSGYTLTGEPKSDAFSVGVRAEQSFKAGAGKVVPYAGLRYMHLGTGNYTNSIGLSYDADDANLFLLPVGVKYSAEHKTAGWMLRPIVEVGYVWAMGDRDGQQTVSLNGTSNGFGYDVTDSGSYIGRFVLEAEKANVTYGLGYEYQKGDSVKANKWMVNLNWNF